MWPTCGSLHGDQIPLGPPADTWNHHELSDFYEFRWDFVYILETVVSYLFKRKLILVQK